MTDAATLLAKPLCTLAFCWRIERRDGIAIGLTSHDRPLDIGGLTYLASPGVTPSAIRRTGAVEAAVTDIDGALSSDALTPAELAQGRWDGAHVTLCLTEWDSPGALWLTLAEGTLGAVRESNGAFSATLDSAKAALSRAIAPATSPMCRATLGDRDCRVDMAMRRRILRVGVLAGNRLAIPGTADLTPYGSGRLRWLDGPRCGLWDGIAGVEAGALLLDDAPDEVPVPGTRILVEEGCDRRIATCSARFSNAANFRGEPYLPGTDLLTRYPGAS